MTDCYYNGGFTRRASGAFTADETDVLVDSERQRGDGVWGWRNPRISIG